MSSSSPINVNGLNQDLEDNDDQLCILACQIANCSVFPMALKAALDLDLLESMAKAGPNAYISALEISSKLGTQNPNASSMLDRLLRLLTSFSILKCSQVTTQDGKIQRLYGLASVCKYFTRDQDNGVSVAPLALMIPDKVFMDSWYHFKDAVMEGGIPFNRAHGMSAFEYPGVDFIFNQVFNKAMSDHTTLTMKKVLETYKGFEGIKVLVDVGGGVGVTTKMITAKYPELKGINFDLPHVLADAPSYPGVEHVGGDMFLSVPRGEAIFMKWILHDWSDEHCLKLLKNCYEALPDCGKVIIVEANLPAVVDESVTSKLLYASDMIMLAQNPGGKERTFSEFEALAKQSGFASCEILCPAYYNVVMEFHKTAKD
ncbi:hypothetical protein MKW94_016914 [Papaver nudicaule]|uniref:Uncharacterized protein n=1 Tax=Papaver nudicaule TaxID=74823 RepID=A0AA41SDE8_PAPNU|nr:hypothetical protein [Papaver nudicaule]